MTSGAMPENLVAVVEMPKGSSNKYEWDEVRWRPTATRSTR